MELPSEPEVLGRLVAWAEAEDAIRALVLTSSRARADETVDVLSDYDVVVAVRDADAFAAGRTWDGAYGRRLAAWGDEGVVRGLRTWFHGVVYDDGVKIDYTVWPVALLELVADGSPLPDALDVGYRVLLDKDGATAGWPPPTFRAHVPVPPSADEYRAVVEEFWWTTTYAAKSIWRGELLFVKFHLVVDLTFGSLRRMLEWRVELDHGWSLRPGAYGRGLERLLPAGMWDELAATFVGTDVEDALEALWRLTELFRRVAREVGAALGHPYPDDVDAGVTALLERVRRLPPRDGA